MIMSGIFGNCLNAAARVERAGDYVYQSDGSSLSEDVGMI
jgi:hypothetical protein